MSAQSCKRVHQDPESALDCKGRALGVHKVQAQGSAVVREGSMRFELGSALTGWDEGNQQVTALPSCCNLLYIFTGLFT